MNYELNRNSFIEWSEKEGRKSLSLEPLAYTFVRDLTGLEVSYRSAEEEITINDVKYHLSLQKGERGTEEFFQFINTAILLMKIESLVRS